MAIIWSWEFHDEDMLDLEKLGFTHSSNDNTYRASSRYSFSPDGAAVTGSAFEMETKDQYLVLPADVAAPEGAVAAAQRLPDGFSFATKEQLYVGNSDGAIYTYHATNTVRLYVDNVYKATGATISGSRWRYWTLKYSCTGSTWYASVWLDGQEYISEQSDAEAAQTGNQTVRFYGTSDDGWPGYDAWGAWANIILYDAYADDSEKVRYVARLDPNTDTSETGTWVPDSGTDNFARLSGSLNSSTYTQESSPSDGDEVITSFSGNIAATLGVTPTAVKAVTVHAASSGLANVTRAEVGDQGGSVTTAGANTSNGDTTTYQYATATTKPSGGAWATTDTIKCKFEYSGSA